VFISVQHFRLRVQYCHFMLGLIPAFTGFFGLELEFGTSPRPRGYHGGRLTRFGGLHLPAIWRCIAAIPLIGALNLGA
jgi:hypothetical protein